MSNLLFLNSQALKLIDLVEFQTAQIMNKARNKLQPGNIPNEIERGLII